jgi:hypothetical protein
MVTTGRSLIHLLQTAASTTSDGTERTQIRDFRKFHEQSESPSQQAFDAKIDAFD